jgi:ABC-type lipoprotein export system ATPase subunit
MKYGIFGLTQTCFTKIRQMNDILFTIQDLTCSYKRGDDVLRIHRLEIPFGKFIVLIGKSGSGKSTFLETLGLMNNTLKTGDIIFHPRSAESPVSYKKLWELTDSSELAEIRRKYFSFIFQNTNLMPNFTAYENACLTQMIQGISMSQSMKKVKSLMSSMGLGEVPDWKNASELSGGQKQRLAFVRAISSEFVVLFGDEPTGNLDEFNSDELMARLQSNIAEKGSTAIIVSHNINLSVKYADIIIVLKKQDENQACYEIGPSSVYKQDLTKKNWVDWQDRIIPDIAREIQELID